MKNKGIFLLFLLVISTFSFAQENTSSLNKYKNKSFVGEMDTSLQTTYPFIHFERNNYRFFTPNSPNFEYLFFKLQQLVNYKKGQLNFYQIGGSHIQADIYTNVMRQQLHQYWKNVPGARGLIFPFGLAGSNNPWNYSFHSKNHWTGYRSVVNRPDSVDFGLDGDAITSSDTYIQLQFNYKNPIKGTPITHIRLYHNKGNMPYRFYYQVDKGMVLTQKTNQKEGFTDTYFSQPVKSFTLHFIQKSDSAIADIPSKNLFIYGFYLGNQLPGIVFSGIGSNGASLDTYLENPNFEKQLADFPPDFFAIAIGTNDGNKPYDDFYPLAYKAKMDSLIQLVLQANPKCAILLTVPNDSYFEVTQLNKNIAREREMLIELAKKYKFPIWDLYGIMGGLGSSQTWYEHHLMRPHKIHFTADGYRLYGNLYFAAFIKWIDQMEKRHTHSILHRD